MKTDTKARVHYCIVTHFAGIAWSRSSSPIERFSDANREAMRACAEKNKPMRVYAYAPGGWAGDLVAEYAPVNGRAQCVPV